MFKTLIFFSWLLFHPVHITMTSIDYIPEMDSYKVFVRMYFDDFLLDYKLCGKEVDSKDFIADTSYAKDIIEKYIGERLSIKVNEKELFGKLNNIKLVDNEVSVDLEYKAGPKPRTITIKSLIMTGLYSDQANMIIIRINDFEEGVKLTSDITEQTFKIK
ncbi:MAG TPA: DUF6702 family protein [Bacteroidales bacterium]|nr:DUF6702 family protein [Bacteroidales bacterium]